MALQAAGLLDDVGVVEIDPSLSDTAATQGAFGLDPESLANCVVVAGKRSGVERLAACVVLATTAGGHQPNCQGFSRCAQGVLPANGPRG